MTVRQLNLCCLTDGPDECVRNSASSTAFEFPQSHVEGISSNNIAALLEHRFNQRNESYFRRFNGAAPSAEFFRLSGNNDCVGTAVENPLRLAINFAPRIHQHKTLRLLKVGDRVLCKELLCSAEG